MGFTTKQQVFQQTDVFNRDLILKMLKYEDELYLSSYGQKIIGDPGMNNIFTLENSKTIQRLTLEHFNFSSCNESLSNYRTIFHHYWNSASDYDKDVLSSVYYLRENRCLYYTSPDLLPGDIAPDSELYELDGITKTSVHQLLKEQPTKQTIIAAFSTS